MNVKTLLSMRIDRRAVAAVFFRDLHMEHAQVRHLHSKPQSANESAIAFIRWLITRFSPDAVVFEKIDAEEEYRRVALSGILLETVRSEALPVFDATKNDLFVAYSIPPLASRKSLREIASTLWPALAAKGSSVLLLDAAALGLYTQAERLLAQDV